MTEHPSGPQKEDVDAGLVTRAQEGDAKAFDELVVKYTPKLYGMIYNMTSNREDTRDLLQDTFSKAYRSLRKFGGRSSFYTWIYSIGVNTTLNYLKKRKKRSGMSLDDVNTGIQNDPAFIDITYVVNPRHKTSVNELQEKLNKALQSLSEQHRAVVTMFDIQGMPHAQISKILGVSEGTVRSRLFYAHQHLQSYLSEFYKG